VNEVYESIQDSVSAALQGGAGVGAAVAATQDAISAKGLEIATKLDSALAAGNQGDIRVELTALYQFFGELKGVLAELDQAETALTAESVSDELAMIVDTVDGMFGASIPGVHSALQAAQQNLDPSTPGLLHTVRGLQAMVTRNLQALYDTYVSYLAADRDGASALSDASRTYIGTQWQTIAADSAPASPKPSGWARYLAV
jgi:hypothetical protein